MFRASANHGPTHYTHLSAPVDGDLHYRVMARGVDERWTDPLLLPYEDPRALRPHVSLQGSMLDAHPECHPRLYRMSGNLFRVDGGTEALYSLIAQWVDLPLLGDESVRVLEDFAITCPRVPPPHYAVRDTTGLSLVWLVEPVPAETLLLRRWQAAQRWLREHCAGAIPAEDPAGWIRAAGILSAWRHCATTTRTPGGT